ncbi:PAS domain S-box-containing protein/diguanylate cyclase (GGDEF) domain-containing protein [Pseudomonas gessardii]|uniref:bifunctional diguanylate cyclase/phosphodiesterase n=1 Tax=Pseudomonas gessardii TaxID=78544 RepID=UPI00088C295C|nr:EAL domain-containing protein [Pseudomonas gessardii]MRU52160.1 EAL domain-containing protein [Pseudomonas gessardii]ONH40301.1 diguanylate cyclase [Pseudomonas gessardii]SDQ45013.1 PAS domain S-box-containing protein/diguanylate cyclase (GGDEF) domain-containing protein [Pseudomonas gessardii]
MEKLNIDPKSSLKGKVSNLSTARAYLLACSLLLLAMFLLVGVLLVSIAAHLNHDAGEHTRIDIENALQSVEKVAASTVKDYAFWGDAYIHLHQQVDVDWAFARQNLGSTLFTDLGFEGVFVVDASGRTVYSVIEGQLQAVAVQDWLPMPIEPLLAQAREAAVNGQALSRLVQADGTLAVLAAAALTPGIDPNVKAEAGPAAVLIFIAKLAPQRLAALGQEFGVQDLRVVPAGGVAAGVSSLSLRDNAGVVQWTADDPGHQLLVLVVPLVIVAGLIFTLMAWVIQRRSTAAARVMDSNYATLQASRAALAVSEERFRDVAEAASDWIWEVDTQLRFTYLSERFDVITGLVGAKWLGLVADDLLTSDQGLLSAWFKDHARRPNAIVQCSYLCGGGELRICRLSVREIPGQGYRGTASDITEEVEARRRIEYLSQHDALTGLANRTRMQEFLEGKLKAVPTLERPLVMLSIDLDRFKPVNDLLGHAAGDDVLNQVSRRLQGCLRGDDLVARIGGDEFMLVVADMSSPLEVESLCRRLIDGIEQPFYLAEHEVFISASIGIAMAPADAIQAEELLRYADIALYEAKDGGRNTWRFYAGDMNARIIERRQLEADLRHAIKNGELRLDYQPRYRIEDKRLAGAEALVRWQHPRRGLLGPDVFIPIAEETGLILPLSNWVLYTACRAAAGWPEEVMISVNLSSTEFQRGHLVARVKAVLVETGLNPARLELELTESVMLNDEKVALNIMQGLKALGVRLLMDDFGTGYSSLSYLRSFPFDGLKIDRSFVGGLTASGGDQSIIQAIVGLGRALSLTVTAEGVETIDQLKALKDVQCDEAQGFYLSVPMNAQAIGELIAGCTD